MKKICTYLLICIPTWVWSQSSDSLKQQAQTKFAEAFTMVKRASESRVLHASLSRIISSFKKLQFARQEDSVAYFYRKIPTGDELYVSFVSCAIPPHPVEHDSLKHDCIAVYEPYMTMPTSIIAGELLGAFIRGNRQIDSTLSPQDQQDALNIFIANQQKRMLAYLLTGKQVQKSEQDYYDLISAYIAQFLPTHPRPVSQEFVDPLVAVPR